MATQVKPATTANASPGTEDAAAKQEKPKRIDHPLIGNPDSSVYPFTSTPPDFDAKTHKPLRRKDFAADHMYFAYQLERHDAQREILVKKIEEAKAGGSKREQAKAKRLVKMQEKVSELRKSLEAQGIDVDALLAADTEDA